MENTSNLWINCDMGEWDAPHLTPCDDKLMPYIDLCNIACGGHAGNQQIIEDTIRLAHIHNVKVGAHPGYEDKVNFGRKYHSFSEKNLIDILNRQLDLFLAVCADNNTTPFHVKAHGALYHTCNQNQKEADLFVKILQDKCPSLIVLVAPNSLMIEALDKVGMEYWVESFIDRKYNDNLSLVARSEENSVITNVQEAHTQFLKLSSGQIQTKSGNAAILQSKTACVHGDNPMAIEILKAIRA